VWICVRACMYVCVYVHVCLYVSVHVNVYGCMECVCMYVHVGRMCMHVEFMILEVCWHEIFESRAPVHRHVQDHYCLC